MENITDIDRKLSKLTTEKHRMGKDLFVEKNKDEVLSLIDRLGSLTETNQHNKKLDKLKLKAFTLIGI